MRYAPRRGFRYPVLGQRDFYYPEKKFEVELFCNTSESDKAITFWADFSLDVEAINDFIDEGKAICMLWVYCSSTSFREIYRHNGDGLRHVKGTIPIGNLRGNIEFHPSVIATEEISLPLDEAHEAFKSDGSSAKLVCAGSPLAVHKPSYTKLDFDSDRSTRSIFQLKEDSDLPEGAWEISADPRQPVVVLRAHPVTKSNFQEFRNKKQAMRTLDLAAMVQTLNIFLESHEPDAEADSSRWVGVIAQKLPEIDVATQPEDEGSAGVSGSGSSASFISLDNGTPLSPLWVAQSLLGNPLERLHQEDHQSEANGETNHD